MKFHLKVAGIVSESAAFLQVIGEATCGSEKNRGRDRKTAVIVLATETLPRFENSRNVELSTGMIVDLIAGCNFHVLRIIKTSK